MGKNNILIVDNEPDIVRTIAIMLEMEGYNAVSATSGEDAMEIMRINTPDLVILDLLLPGMSGQDVAATLKNDAKYRDIPLILITAQANKCDLATLKEFSADFCLVKPFELSVLRGKIEELLKK
jgi:CheY-like chemotaxis protein